MNQGIHDFFSKTLIRVEFFFYGSIFEITLAYEIGSNLIVEFKLIANFI
jgi:hypothetical protein